MNKETAASEKQTPPSELTGKVLSNVQKCLKRCSVFPFLVMCFLKNTSKVMGNRMGNWDGYWTCNDDTVTIMLSYPEVFLIIYISHLYPTSVPVHQQVRLRVPIGYLHRRTAHGECWLVLQVAGGRVHGLQIWEDLPERPEIRCVWPGSLCLRWPLQHSKDTYLLSAVTPNEISANPRCQTPLSRITYVVKPTPTLLASVTYVVKCTPTLLASIICPLWHPLNS